MFLNTEQFQSIAESIEKKKPIDVSVCRNPSQSTFHHHTKLNDPLLVI